MSGTREHTDRGPLIAVVGATATGKTGTGIALARALGGEIVGADSRQVYRDMAIGTAQPSRDELAAARHHLVGILDPDAAFGLATYLELAAEAIAGIRGRGRVPILVGGTGQYVWALLEQWTVPKVPPDAALRANLERFAAEHGAGALHARLRELDPDAARAIHPNNIRRVVRAIEVIRHTGRRFSEQQGRRSAGDALIIGLTMPRSSLYHRIDRRVERMYAEGLLDELRALQHRGYGRYLPSMESIGYPEAWAVLAEELSVAEAVRRTREATHRLARQQATWFRADDPRIHWLAADDPVLAKRAISLARGYLDGRLDEGTEHALHQDARHG